MPCAIPGHKHEWPEQGELVIEKCERWCGYCDDMQYAEHAWKFAWFLRRHVRTVHCGEDTDYPNVTVSEGWTGSPPKRPRPAHRRSHRIHRSTGDASYTRVKKEAPSTPSPKKRSRAKSNPSPRKARTDPRPKKDPATPSQGITSAMRRTAINSDDETKKEMSVPRRLLFPPPLSAAELKHKFTRAVEDLSQQGIDSGIPVREVTAILSEQSMRMTHDDSDDIVDCVDYIGHVHDDEWTELSI